MQYEEFRQRVEEQIGADRADDPADKAIAVTLQTLSERLSGGEAKDLAAQLSGELQSPLQQSDEAAEDFSVEEFFRRIAEREGVDVDTARDDAAVVMRVLREALTQGELDDVMAQLPPEFNERLSLS